MLTLPNNHPQDLKVENKADKFHKNASIKV